MIVAGWQELLIIFALLLVTGGPLLVAYVIARSVVKRSVKQEIDDGVERIEKRIEALETIVLDRSKSGDSPLESLDQKEL